MRVLFALVLLGLIHQIQSWCLRTTLSQKQEIREVDWAQDNSIFVTANKAEMVVRFYDAKSFELLKIYKHLTGIQPKSIKISKNSQYIAVGYANSDLVVFYAASPFDIFFTKATVQTVIAEVDFSYDSNSIVTCGEDQGIKTWSLTVATPATAAAVITHKFLSNPGKAVACRYGPLGDIIFTDDNNRVRMYRSGTQVDIGQFPDRSYEADFLASSSTVATANKDKNLRFNISVVRSDTDDIITVSMGKEGRHYAYGGKTKTLFICNQTNNNLLAKFRDFRNTINSVKLSKDEQFIITGDVSGDVRVYSTKCGSYGCESGEYNSSGVCKKCSQTITYCITCKSASSCQICMAGYYKSGSACVACYVSLSYCLSCKDNTECTKCLDGFYLDSSTKKCVKCPLVGCIQCNTSAICTKCFKNDYYLDTGTNTCKQCADTLSNCVRCSDGATCVDCQIGFYEDPTTKKCVQCPGNCLACQSSTNCTQCKVGYWPSSNTCVRCTVAGCVSCNQTGVCYDCKEGMFLTPANACTSCTSPCSTCSVAATNCTGCNIGYYLDTANFQCVKCIENCKACNESAKCLSCFPGFKVDATTSTCKPCSVSYANCSQCSSTQCLKCRQGFYADTAASYACKTCVSVIPNCMNCANTTNCIQCVTGYFNPAGVTGANSCSACASGCQQCISSTNCTNCFPTFFKNSTLLCEPCKNKCFECTSEFVCASCVTGYYLDTTTCKACPSILPYCSACTDPSTCITCMPGTYLDSADNKCKLCSLADCLTCNKTFCYSCKVGHYLDTTSTPHSCPKCPEPCQQCTSPTVCSSCIDGYYFDSADTKCKPCSTPFLYCTLCNKTSCLECETGTQMNTSNGNACSPCINHIANCKTCYWDNSIATPVVKCSLCNYGFGLAATNLTCPACMSIGGCIECKSATLCTKCEIGFYLKTDNTCGLCKENCLTCDNALTCLACRDGYVNDTGTCVLCETKIMGCSRCIVDTATTYNCSYCQMGYFLDSATKQCFICNQQINGCYTCNDSSTCTACLDKYFLDTSTATHTCKKCVTNIPGCQICNSSSICISCEDSYYLFATDHKCYFCSNTIPGCLHCLSPAQCSQCESGYFLSLVTNTCNLCQSIIEGCIYCNSQTYCIQCRAGYYLNSGDNKCHKCALAGCEICSESSPSSCVTCNSKYYLGVGAVCLTCRSRVGYCDQCNATDCLSCEVGYYLAGTSSCLTCSSTMNGCSRCVDAGTCLECMSSYYVTAANKCGECNRAMFGCQNCIDSSTCVSCEANFFLNSTDKCQPCTDITGCMLCRNESTCVMCQEKYFMNGSSCLLCSTAIKGCFSCVSATVCVQCQSGYVLDTTTYECSVNTVEAKQAVEGLKLVTYYVSKDMLKHVLFSKTANFKHPSITTNLTSNGQTSLFVEDYTGKEVQLSVLSYQFGKSGNSIIFYTDNPLSSQMESKSKQMQFRRLLMTELNLQVMVKMNEDVYREILPDLDYSGSMTVGYSLNDPEFMNSYMTVEAGNRYLMYEIVGVAAVTLFLLNYVIKFLCTMPQSKNRSTLLPHIIALKSCCLILYPSHFEYISFCKGFMYIDFPWLNTLLATTLTNESDHVEVPFGLFFQNMSIAGTFLLGFGAYITLVLLVHAYFYVTRDQPQPSSSQQNSQRQSSQLSSDEQRQKQKQFRIQKLESAMGINYDNDESQTNPNTLNKRNFLELLWNIFTFSMVYYSCVCVQGAFFNYTQIITLNGVFYIMGMLMFIYVTVETFYSFVRNFKNICKVRIWVKACLLALAHFNPVYIVSVCVLVDMLLAGVQFYLVNKKNQFSKFFILTHILSSLVLALMIFVSGSLVSLFSTAISLIICFGFEVFIHIKEYQNAHKNVDDEEFKMDEDDEKHHSDQADEGLPPSNNIWDLGRKSSPNRKPKMVKEIDMYATMQAFQNNKTFDMQNVDLHGGETIYRPQTSLPHKHEESHPMAIKQGGRRSKHRRTQQAFRSNVIEILPNPRMEQKQRNAEREGNRFSLEGIDSRSP